MEIILFWFILVAGASHLRDVFYRMGLSDKDIVALSGGHTLVLFDRCSSFLGHQNIAKVDVSLGFVGKGSSR